MMHKTKVDEQNNQFFSTLSLVKIPLSYYSTITISGSANKFLMSVATSYNWLNYKWNGMVG